MKEKEAKKARASDQFYNIGRPSATSHTAWGHKTGGKNKGLSMKDAGSEKVALEIAALRRARRAASKIKKDAEELERAEKFKEMEEEAIQALATIDDKQRESLLQQATALEHAFAGGDVIGRLQIGATLTIGNYLAVNMIADFRRRCAEERIPGVFIEGGAQLISELIRVRQLDYLFAYHAPLILADEKARSILGGLRPERLEHGVRLEDGRIEVEGIAGTSAGAMNAVVFAYGRHLGGAAGARQLLHDFWQRVSGAGKMFGLVKAIKWEFIPVW